MEGRGITIWGEPAWEKEARYLEAVFPAIVGELESALGRELRTQPGVLLVGRKEIFEHMTGNPLVSAFAVPSQGFIALHLSPLGAQRQILRETFSHELCHLLLHENIRQELLPKWLDEGICQWVSGSLGEILSGEGFDPRAMDLARHPIPLGSLHRSFPGDKDGMLRAYAQGRSMVEYLNRRYGKEAIQHLLQRLEEGYPIDRAMPAAFGLPMDQLEREWLESVEGTRIWLLWVSGHLYDVIFFGAALLTILAFLRIWLRRRRSFEIDEDQ